MSQAESPVETARQLDALLTALQDARHNFAEASSKIGSPQLAAMLEEYANDCTRALHALQKSAQSLGEPSAVASSLGGAVRKGWIKLKAALAADAELAALEEAEHEHQRVVAAFEQVLGGDPPPPVREEVEREQQRILRWTESLKRTSVAR